MKRRVLVAMGIMWMLVSCAQNHWIRVNSTDGRFTVLMPGQPKRLDTRASGPLGTAPSTSLVSESSGIVIGVTFVDPPRQLAATSSVPEVLDNARDGMLGSDTELISEKTIVFQRHPGRCLSVSAKDGSTYTEAMLLMVVNRLYVLQVVSEGRRPDLSLADRFFQSFRVLHEGP